MTGLSVCKMSRSSAINLSSSSLCRAASDHQLFPTLDDPQPQQLSLIAQDSRLTPPTREDSRPAALIKLLPPPQQATRRRHDLAASSTTRSSYCDASIPYPSSVSRKSDMVVHLSGSRVLRPVLVHPDEMTSPRRMAAAQKSLSVSVNLTAAHLLQSLAVSSSQAPSSASASSRLETLGRRGGSPPQVARQQSEETAPMIDRNDFQEETHLIDQARGPKYGWRSDSEPKTRAELTRYGTVESDPADVMPSVMSINERLCRELDPSLGGAAATDRDFKHDIQLDLSTGVADGSHLDLLQQRPNADSRISRTDVPGSASDLRGSDCGSQPPDSLYPDTRIYRRSASRSVDDLVSSRVTITDQDALPQNSTSASNPSRPAHRRNSRRRPMRLRINVSGQYFEIGRRQLALHPSTLLGDGNRWIRYYDVERDELFFDRHRPSFEAIFAYYQTGGRLRRPYNVPDDVFLEELEFFDLEPEIVSDYKRQEGYSFDEPPMPTNRYMRYVWTLFEYPNTSRAAFFIAILSVMMTLVSIILFCVETLPVFSQSHCVNDEAPNFGDPFFVIETICTAWFTIEAIFRFIACPSKIGFWKDFKNIVDVMAVVPYYVTLFNVLSTMSCSGAKSSASLSFLRVIRLVRIFKLTKHSVGLQVLMMTFKASLEGLGLFLVALFVSLLVFSSAIYYAELGQPRSQMYSIPDAFWWAIITMTTVGYGDKVPVGPIGRLIGAACAITGVLTLSIPVPIITGHFNRFYAHKTGRGRHM